MKIMMINSQTSFVNTFPKRSRDREKRGKLHFTLALCSFQTAWISPNEEQFDALLKFLNKRLDEGHGETILEIGTGGKCG